MLPLDTPPKRGLTTQNFVFFLERNFSDIASPVPLHALSSPVTTLLV